MSDPIGDLISQVEEEDRLRRDDYKIRHVEQLQKFGEMVKRITHVKDESAKHQENITKSLKLLIDNKHTIEKHALQQTDNLMGLPIPYDQHKSIIDLFSSMTGFLNKAEIITTPETFSPDEIKQTAIIVTENAAGNLKEYASEVVQARDLFNHAKLMKNLLDSSDEPENFENSLVTIHEDS